jgi:hypothetical protein
MTRTLIRALLVTGALAAPVTGQVDRGKNTRVVSAPDLRHVAVAAAAAFQGGSYRLSTIVADSGLVRGYEEHLRVDTLRKGEPVRYYCVDLIAACRASYKPPIFQERGMVVTWRQVSVLPAEPGKFRVAYELWDPSEGGVADDPRPEGRDGFFKRFQDVLQAMERRPPPVTSKYDFSDFARVVERDRGAPAPHGVYELTTMNGKPLPQPSGGYGMVVRGWYVIRPDGTFRQVLSTSIGWIDNAGKYTKSGNTTIFSGDKAMQAARLEGDSLAYGATGVRFMYRRMP